MLDRGKVSASEEATSNNDARAIYKILRDLTGKIVNTSVPIKVKMDNHCSLK